jgi:hypothetical protein
MMVVDNIIVYSSLISNIFNRKRPGEKLFI